MQRGTASGGDEQGESRGNEIDPNASELLHTGDIIFLKCQLRESERFAEAGTVANDTGYISANGLHGSLEIKVNDDLQSSLEDIRGEYLFVVLEQLSYNAQKDLQKRKKQLLQDGIDIASSSHHHMQLRSMEERAHIEALANLRKLKAKPRRVNYGDIIQLQHYRTGRFLRVRAKTAAALSLTSRMVELQEGNSSSWFRTTPFFKHKTQGDPVAMNEQVLLESVRLGQDWNLNWSKCHNLARDQVREVNCARNGRSLYFVLYSRTIPVSVSSTAPAMAYPAALRLWYPHFHGYLSGSCKTSKREPRLRRAKEEMGLGRSDDNAKDIWILQPATGAPPDKGIMWAQTTVLLRHFGSKRYLALNEHSLNASGLLKENSRAALSPVKTVSTELVSMPGLFSHFVLEPTGLLQAQTAAKGMGSGGLVPKDNAAVILRWSSPLTGSLWLSCTTESGARKNSLGIVFSTSRLSRDSIVCQCLDGTSFMEECDVVAEQKHVLTRNIIPRCQRFTDTGVAAYVCSQLEHSLTDMIFFLTDSTYWRTDSTAPVADPLTQTWVALPRRQEIAKQMKYLDCSFQLFHELVKQTDSLVAGDARWGRRAAQLEAKMHAREAAISSKNISEEVGAWEEVMGSMISTMKTRCLKLLVRLWLCSFLGSRKIEVYFHQKGWLDVLNTLNGFGLGASDVFVKLVSNNADLARTIDRETLLKFLDFIRVLGPLDTWFYFLKAVCAPLQTALPVMQQTVLRCLVFAGQRTPVEEARIAERNRNELLVSVALGPPLGIPLGQASRTVIAPLERVLATRTLTEGVSDVLVSWTYPNLWVAGKSVLFHGPEALGLQRVSVPDSKDGRAWVSLAQIAWVLQPQQCCEAATGRTWQETQEMEHSSLEESRWSSNDATGAGQSRLQNLKTLAKYILAQLRLLDDMVKERQMNCIMTLQEEYSYSLCLCGACDPRLPTSIRAAFFNLVSDLWLDRYPHFNVAVPALMRGFDTTLEVKEELPVFELHDIVKSASLPTPDTWSVEHAARLPEEVKLFYALGNPGKMECALRAVRRFLSAGIAFEQQVHGQPEDIEFMVAVLRLLNMLQMTGFIGEVASLQELQGPLLRCLDGRTDWLSPPPESKPRVLEPVAGAPDVHESIVPLLDRQSHPLSEPVVQGSVLTKDRFPLVLGSERRWEVCEDNKGVFACKVQLLQIVLRTANTSMHVKVSRVLELFRTQIYSPMYSSNAADANAQKFDISESAFQSMLKIMDEPIVDLSQPYVRDPLVMCVDLMMYEDPQVFALALELLFDSCCGAAKLLNLLDKVELLTTAQDKLFSSVKQDVFTIGRLIYSIENWGVDDHFSTMDNVKCKQFGTLCKKIRNLCTHGDSSSSPFEVQKMLHETEFFSHLSYTLKMNINDFPKSSEQLVKTIISQLCNAAVRVVANNSKNQMQAFASISSMQDLVGEHPECALLLAEIFKGNAEFCKQVPQELINLFASLIIRARQERKFVLCYLDFYVAIVSAGNQPIVRNQLPVVDAITNGKPENMLHLLKAPSESERVLELARKFSSKAQMRGDDDDTTSLPSENDQEMMYYLRSLELLGRVAKGRGSQSLVTKPFVASLFHPTFAIRELLRSAPIRERRPRDLNLSPMAVVHLSMACRWMELVLQCLYDVDVNLRDVPLLASPLHSEFMGALLLWVQASLDAPLRINGPEPEEVEYFRVALVCIDSFFSFSFTAVAAFESGDAMASLGREYATFFASTLQSQQSTFRKNANAKRWGVAYAESTLLQITGSRVLQATTEDVDALRYRPLKSQDSKSSSGATSEIEEQWRRMLVSLRNDKRFSERVAAEDEQVGRCIETMASLTDPDNHKYMHFLPHEPHASLPDGIDFRRSLINCEDVLQRIMRHEVDMRSDFDTLRRIQRMLMAMIRSARKSSDPNAVAEVQRAIVNAGVTHLVLRMLDDQVFVGAPLDIGETAWSLLIEVLCEVRREGAYSVNKMVQQALLEVCKSGDDAGMFESFKDIMATVSSKAKSTRSLKLVSSLIEEEQMQVEDYKMSLSHAVGVMEAMRLMVEGHYHPMQQHLLSQSGRERVCNVPETTMRLFNQIVKDPKSGDAINFEEIQCMSQVLRLLIELCQGPNLHNQEFVSNLGLVETASRLLSVNFEDIRRSEGDVYPLKVRSLKALLMEAMLALVEGRMDDTIHVIIPQRMDPEIMKARLQFVYNYFVFGLVGVATRAFESDQMAAVPLDSKFHVLLSSSADPTAAHEVLLEANALAEEMLEDLSDDDISNYFSEGLMMLQLIFQVSPFSAHFEKFVTPVSSVDDSFVDDPKAYLTERQFVQEKQKYCGRYNYRLAFQFLQRFVRTIEVVMDGHLHYLHFCLPVTSMWYVYGEAKQHILDTVPFSSPDIKAKAFINMCLQVHVESKLIKDLSRFSIMPERLLKIAQRNIPDWMHRPFQIFLCDDARNMGRLLRAALYIGLLLAMHVSVFLVPIDEDDQVRGGPESEFVSFIAQWVADILGLIYLVCTLLWLLLTISIKLPFVLRTSDADSKVKSSSGPFRASFGEAMRVPLAFGKVLMDGNVSWRLTLFFFTGYGFAFRHYWLLSFILMDFWCQSSVLATVFRAIASPLKSLVMVFLGSIIVTFVYAAVGFRYFRKDFHDFCNENIYLCTQNIIYQGTRSGIVGLSMMMRNTFPGQDNWTSRMLYDISYFVIFGIIILNTIVGLIVDSFGALRLEVEARENNQETQTFISCIARRTIEAVAQSKGITDGFEYHETMKQNKWDYMAFIFHLQETAVENLTGPEHHIKSLVDKKDVKWIPVSRSKFLEGTELGTNREDQLIRIQLQTQNLKSFVDSNQDNMTGISRSVGQLDAAIRERMDSMLLEIRELGNELKHQRMLKELEAEQGSNYSRN